MKIREVKEWIANKNDEDTFILLVDKNNLPTDGKDMSILSKFSLDTQENMDELIREFDMLVDERYQKALKDNPDVKIASSTVAMESTQFKLMALAALDSISKEENETKE